jgi:nucleotide sugar dehydrogenase
MAVAVANARDESGGLLFNVIGVDLPDGTGPAKVRAINEGRLPVVSTDDELVAAFGNAWASGNLIATTNEEAFCLADITVVDIHLDIESIDGRPGFCLDAFRKAMCTLGARMRPGSLVIVETTVPPGTCRHVAIPELARALAARGLPANAVHLAHSYERVTPGKEYYRSIVNFWRVYAGETPEAADACAAFLSHVIHVKQYPLTRLHSTVASETAKVLENSYRAVNIAFIEEWARFAEAAGVDLFEVVNAIRIRPTHSNMRQPGFGVGGYCLTKDPLFAAAAARQLLGRDDLCFPFSEQAVEANSRMPLRTLFRVREAMGGSLLRQRLLLLGVSYLNDVGDTRHSPSETFVRAAEIEGAQVTAHDPLVSFWPEMGRSLPGALPSPAGFDAVVFAVPHREYTGLDIASWLDRARPLLFDANGVLSGRQRTVARGLGCRVAAIGIGDECLEH